MRLMLWFLIISAGCIVHFILIGSDTASTAGKASQEWVPTLEENATNPAVKEEERDSESEEESVEDTKESSKEEGDKEASANMGDQGENPEKDAKIEKKDDGQKPEEPKKEEEPKEAEKPEAEEGKQAESSDQKPQEEIKEEPKAEEAKADQAPTEEQKGEEKKPEPQKELTPPPAPEPVPAQALPAVEKEKLPEEEIIRDIDTMDIEQPEGNWLQKRYWWEQSKETYKKVRELFEQIFKARMDFLEKRSNIEKTVFDPFMREIGIEQEELRETIDSLLDLLEDECPRESLGKEEIDFINKVFAAKNELEQLKSDIDTINNIDAAIEAALATLSNKINEASAFERSAWDEFDAVARELSDTRARERYHFILNIYDNLKALQAYLQNEFTTYFDTIVQSAKDKTERFKETVKKLKDQGIDLKVEASKLEEVDEEEEARLAAEKAAQEEAAKRAKAAAEAAKVGFFGKMFAGILGALKWLWNALFGWWLYRI